jgi:hypothetical protein
MPLLSSPLAIAMLSTPAAKLKESSSLLASCRDYVENNIKKRMELIIEAYWRNFYFRHTSSVGVTLI